MSEQAFRAAALALPEACEQDHFGAPSFRARGKIFAQLSADGRRGLVKLPTEIQSSLGADHPEACVPDAGWGRFGWTWITLRLVDPTLVADLLDLSWRTVTPKSMHRIRTTETAIPTPA